MYFWERAAHLGDSEAMVRLSREYFSGEHVPRCDEEAFFWLQDAAMAEKEEGEE